VPENSSTKGVPEKVIWLWREDDVAFAKFTIYRFLRNGELACAAAARFDGRYSN
jgi:hypothetical protein